MKLRKYSKLALIALAAASLTLAGCSGKKDDSTLTSNIKKGEMSSNSSNSSGVNGSGVNGSGVNGSGVNGSGVNGSGVNGSGVNGSGVNGSGVNGSGSDSAMKPSTNSVYFAFDSAKIDRAGKAILTGYAKWLNNNPDVNITVEGNCDERGSREYNLALGEERAKSVKSVLVSHGVDAIRIDTVSYGEERPVCSRSGEACWAQNRHGDIVNH
ncbi:MAG: peptidoglycan-associated lipoprotein Pal [Ghiorsea sp.]|nr:peptidoglycan-associated lipoprotein Pal [Ghiorsea sp.]